MSTQIIHGDEFLKSTSRPSSMHYSNALLTLTLTLVVYWVSFCCKCDGSSVPGVGGGISTEITQQYDHEQLTSNLIKFNVREKVMQSY